MITLSPWYPSQYCNTPNTLRNAPYAPSLNIQLTHFSGLIIIIIIIIPSLIGNGEMKPY